MLSACQCRPRQTCADTCASAQTGSRTAASAWHCARPNNPFLCLSTACYPGCSSGGSGEPNRGLSPMLCGHNLHCQCVPGPAGHKPHSLGRPASPLLPSRRSLGLRQQWSPPEQQCWDSPPASDVAGFICQPAVILLPSMCSRSYSQVLALGCRSSAGTEGAGLCSGAGQTQNHLGDAARRGAL